VAMALHQITLTRAICTYDILVAAYPPVLAIIRYRLLTHGVTAFGGDAAENTT